jgi:hypothetical protein
MGIGPPRRGAGERYSLKEVKIAGFEHASELAVQPNPEPALAKGAVLESSTIENAMK